MPRRNPVLPFLRRSDPPAQADHAARREPVEPVLVSQVRLARRAPEADYWLRQDTLVEPPIHPRLAPRPPPAPIVVDADPPAPRRKRRVPFALLVAAALLGPCLAALAALQPGLLPRLATALRDGVAPAAPALPLASSRPERPAPAGPGESGAAGQLSTQGTGPAPSDQRPGIDPSPTAPPIAAVGIAEDPAPPAGAAAGHSAVATPLVPAAGVSVPDATPQPALAATPPREAVPSARSPAPPRPPPAGAPPGRITRGAHAEPEFPPIDPPSARRDTSAEREAAAKAVPRNARCALLIRTAQLGIGLEVTDLAYLGRVCAPD